MAEKSATPIRMIQFSPHGTYLVVSGSGPELVLVDARSGVRIGEVGTTSRQFFWSESEDAIFTVDPPYRVITRFQTNPFQIVDRAILPASANIGSDQVWLDPDHAKALVWATNVLSDNQRISSIQVFGLK